jgi:hypothetical protein
MVDGAEPWAVHLPGRMIASLLTSIPGSSSARGVSSGVSITSLAGPAGCSVV